MPVTRNAVTGDAVNAHNFVDVRPDRPNEPDGPDHPMRDIPVCWSACLSWSPLSPELS